jgi:hypothetical protein
MDLSSVLTNAKPSQILHHSQLVCGGAFLFSQGTTLVVWKIWFLGQVASEIGIR